MKSQERKGFEGEFAYHRREWVVQRIGWACMAAFIAAACLGVFGSGPVASEERGSPDALKLRYERFARYASATTLEFIVGAKVGAGAVIECDEAYLHAFETLSIEPQPEAVKSSGGRLHYVFALERVPASITFRLKPQEIGSQSAACQLQSGGSVPITQFIYP